MPGSTPTPGRCSARSSPRSWRTAPRWSWRRTSPRSRGRSPIASCLSWGGASSANGRSLHRPGAPSTPTRSVRSPEVPMWRDTVLVAGKDLRIEARSRVVMHQVVPVAVLVLILFAFALGPDRAPMVQAAPGLFWVAVLFASVLAVQRSFALEAPDGARDGLRLSGLDPAGVFLGKTAAVALQMVVLEVVLTAGVVVLYGSHIRSYPSIVVAGLAGTAGLAAAGTLYGALAAGLR